MTTLKSRLRKYLDIKPQRDYSKEFDEKIKKALDTLDRSFTQRIARFSVVNCINCSKGLIQGRDAIYRNSHGQVFCSHKCIDKLKNTA